MTGQIKCPAGHWHFPALTWKHALCVAAVVVVANAKAPVVANSRHGKYADVRKRREYMRRLMAVRRAAKRVKESAHG